MRETEPTRGKTTHIVIDIWWAMGKPGWNAKIRVYLFFGKRTFFFVARSIPCSPRRKTFAITVPCFWDIKGQSFPDVLNAFSHSVSSCRLIEPLATFALYSSIIQRPACEMCAYLYRMTYWMNSRPWQSIRRNIWIGCASYVNMFVERAFPLARQRMRAVRSDIYLRNQRIFGQTNSRIAVD